MSVNDYDEGLYEAVRTLVMSNELDEASPAYGIAMKVVHEGRTALTPAQLYLYETQIETLLKRRQDPR